MGKSKAEGLFSGIDEKLTISRRGFVKGTVAVGAAAALYGCSKSGDDNGGGILVSSKDNDFDQPAKFSDVKSSSFCAVNCTSRCRLIGRVKDGKLVGVTPGDLPGRPGYGSACLRGQSLPWKLQSHEHRLLYPMYRSDRSKFGTMEGFERITWKRAFEIMAEKIKNASTPAKVRFFQMTGNLAVMMYDAPNRFADTISASLFQWGNEAIMSDHGGSRGMAMCYGVTRGSHDHRDYSNSKMLILWARNVADTHLSEMQYVLDAKEKGVKVITIDPRYSSTGFVSDEWIPIRPGTDSYLALAMMNYIFTNNLQDDNWIKTNTCGPMLIDNATGKYVTDGNNFFYWDNTAGAQATIAKTTGAAYTGDPDISDTERTVNVGGTNYTCKTSFSYLKAEALRHTLPEAAAITGIPEARITSLADFYARNKPCGIRMGQGMQRCNYSYQGFRAVATLAAVCGQIDIQGGGASHMGGSLPIYTHPGWQNRTSWSQNRPGGARVEKRGIDLYNSVDGGEDGNFPKDIPDVLWVCYSNLVNQSPDYNRLTKKVLPNIPFVVYQDPFLTCTSAYSDLLLPAKSSWENWDFVERSPWVLLHKPAIASIGEALSDIEIFSGVAKELGSGYAEYWDKTDKEWVQDRFSNTSTPALNGFTWDEFEKTGIWTIPSADYTPVRTNYNYAGTQTKKFEFYTEAIAVASSLSVEEKRQVVPSFGKPYEDPNDKSDGALANKYPLVFLQYHDRQSVHTQQILIPMLKVVAPEPFIEMNPEDAAARGIKSGDVVRIFNDRGNCKAKAKITPGIIKGVTAMPAGWDPDHFIEGHFQMLTHCKQNNVENVLYESNFAAYDNLVQIVKA